MRYLIILFFISLLPFQALKADMSIDSIKTAQVLHIINKSKNINLSLLYYRKIINNNRNNYQIISFCNTQIGLLKYYTREIDSANYYHNISKEILKKSRIRNHKTLSYQHLLLTSIEYLNKNYLKTIQHADSAIYFQQQLSIQDSLSLIDLYYYKGICFNNIKDYSNAIVQLEHAIEINKNSHDLDWKVSPMYVSLGDLYRYFDHYKLATKYYYKAISVHNLENPSPALAANYYSIARINGILGDFELAKINYKKTINIYKQLYGSNHPNYKSYFNAVATTFHELSQLDSALVYYKKVINEEIRNKRFRLNMIYRNIAELYSDMDSISLAKFYIEKAIINDKHYPSTKLIKAHINRYAAQLYIETNGFENGLNHLDIAEILYTENNQDRNVYMARCHRIRSNYFYKQKKYKEALLYIQKALIANSELFNSLDTDQNPSPLECLSKMHLFEHLLWKSKIIDAQLINTSTTDLRIKLLQTQSITLIAASKVTNSLRASFFSQNGKFLITEQNNKVYHLIIKNAVKLFNETNNKDYLAKAFEISERSKAGILLDDIKESQLKTLDFIPDSLRIKDQQFNKKKDSIELDIYKAKHYNDKSQKEIENLQNNLFLINKKIEALTVFIEHNFESFNKAKLNFQLIPLDSLQKDLTNDQIILEYFIMENELFCFMISKEDIKVNRVKIDESFYNNINTVIQNCRIIKPSSLTKDFEDFKIASHNLYLSLIEPFEDLIVNMKLIIIPDDILFNFPFEVLISNLNDLSSRSPEYLIKFNTIRYSYSSALLMQEKSKNLSENETVLAFIPSYNYIGFNDSSELKKISPLPNSIKELRKIEEYYTTKTYIANDATKDNFIKNASKFSIIHLAMHTDIDNNNPNFSKLIFTPNPDKEFYLYNNEIYNLDFNAKLIVLSACNTGSGKIQKGEGIMSFARAFLFAGCPSLTLTLWTINDQTSSVLMGNYYKYLSKGLSKSKALQKAKLEYLKNADPLKSHPYYWAAYIHIGDDNSVTSLKKSQTLVYTLSLLIFVTIVIIIRKQIKERIKKGE